jgi:hypothetical protein
MRHKIQIYKPLFRMITYVSVAITSALAIACSATPTSTPVPAVPPTAPPVTPRVYVVADQATPTPTPTLVHIATPIPPTPTVVPTLPTFLQQGIQNLYELSHLPQMQGATANQYTSRNWVALEHFFDYFVDDGNFYSDDYGYIDESGRRQSYRMVTGYDGRREYEIVPRVEGPGAVVRLWFAYQQHQSLNNPQDMSQVAEWANWGNLGEMGNVRFYFDDEMVPRLNVGVKDLFVGKNPFPAPLAAFYAAADGGNINYVPIPFRSSLRITTTGRPRLMQIQIKRYSALPADTAPLLSFPVIVSADEQKVLDQAAHAWETCTPLIPGNQKTFPLAIEHNSSAAIDFNSPATISALRITLPITMEDSVWFQIHWDGEEQPSISGPLRAMFGTAERLIPYESLPMGIIKTDQEITFYNNIPMPFQSARLVIVNNRAEELPVTLQVTTHPNVPGTERSRLYAAYGTQRMIQREDDKDNYTIADVQGSGKYLGTILSAWDLDRRPLNGPLPDTWRFPYLESNVDVWVDERLTLPGTGIEDDFNASYYYVYAGYPGYNSKYCLAGVTLLDYSTNKEPSSQYRFYVNDAPEFKDHLLVQVQHGNKGNNLSVTYSSTSFWYQIR